MAVSKGYSRLLSFGATRKLTDMVLAGGSRIRTMEIRRIGRKIGAG
jgi:hypothetical protein